MCGCTRKADKMKGDCRGKIGRRTQNKGAYNFWMSRACELGGERENYTESVRKKKGSEWKQKN